jgi:hypothetical protein
MNEGGLPLEWSLHCGLEDHGWGFGKTEGEKEKTGRETLKTTWRP